MSPEIQNGGTNGPKIGHVNVSNNKKTVMDTAILENTHTSTKTTRKEGKYQSLLQELEILGTEFNSKVRI